MAKTIDQEIKEIIDVYEKEKQSLPKSEVHWKSPSIHLHKDWIQANKDAIVAYGILKSYFTPFELLSILHLPYPTHLDLSKYNTTNDVETENSEVKDIKDLLQGVNEVTELAARLPKNYKVDVMDVMYHTGDTTELGKVRSSTFALGNLLPAAARDRLFFEHVAKVLFTKIDSIQPVICKDIFEYMTRRQHVDFVQSVDKKQLEKFFKKVSKFKESLPENKGVNVSAHQLESEVQKIVTQRLTEQKEQEQKEKAKLSQKQEVVENIEKKVKSKPLPTPSQSNQQPTPVVIPTSPQAEIKLVQEKVVVEDVKSSKPLPQKPQLKPAVPTLPKTKDKLEIMDFVTILIKGNTKEFNRDEYNKYVSSEEFRSIKRMLEKRLESSSPEHKLPASVLASVLSDSTTPFFNTMPRDLEFLNESMKDNPNPDIQKLKQQADEVSRLFDVTRNQSGRIRTLSVVVCVTLIVVALGCLLADLGIRFKAQANLRNVSFPAINKALKAAGISSASLGILSVFVARGYNNYQQGMFNFQSRKLVESAASEASKMLSSGPEK